MLESMSHQSKSCYYLYFMAENICQNVHAWALVGILLNPNIYPILKIKVYQGREKCLQQRTRNIGDGKEENICKKKSKFRRSSLACFLHMIDLPWGLFDFYWEIASLFVAGAFVLLDGDANKRGQNCVSKPFPNHELWGFSLAFDICNFDWCRLTNYFGIMPPSPIKLRLLLWWSSSVPLTTWNM